ncbi:DUF2142 domain-containing protein [Bifidobacterium tsurumiense]|nr:DUF2142 domain-containing protein [Bifidobacterium tsurumiense]
MKQPQLQAVAVFLSRAIQPEWVFIVLALIGGVASALFVPAGAGLDEPSHIARVEQIVHGGMLPQKLQKSTIDSEWSSIPDSDFDLYGGETDAALVETSVGNMRSMHTSKQVYAYPTWNDPNISSDAQVGGARKIPFVFSNSAINSPVVYVPQGVGFAIGRLFTSNAYALIIAMRIMAVLFYAISLFVCIRLAPFGRWVLASIALIPNNILTNAMVSADTVTFVAATALIVSVLRAVSRETITTAQWVVIAGSSFVLALSKITYIPFLVALAALPLSKEKIERKAIYVRVIGIWLVCFVVWLLWYMQIHHINTGAMFKSGVDPHAQMQFIMSHPIGFIKIAISNLLGTDYLSVHSMGILTGHGSFAYAGSITMILLIMSILCDSTMVGSSARNSSVKPFAWLLAICIPVIIILIEVAVYTQFMPVGSTVTDGVQERYFLPLIFPTLLFGLIFTLPEPSDSAFSEVRQQRSSWMTVLFQFMALGVLLLQLGWTLFGISPVQWGLRGM